MIQMLQDLTEWVFKRKKNIFTITGRTTVVRVLQEIWPFA